MALKKQPKKLEKEYIRLTPSIILLFNAISGILTLCNNYSYYYIIASLKIHTESVILINKKTSKVLLTKSCPIRETGKHMTLVA